MPPREIISGFTQNFLSHKDIIDQVLSQLDLQAMYWRPSDKMNDIATLIRHLSGHLSSRFYDFFYSDGEQPTRNKAAEFLHEPLSIEELQLLWENAWITVLNTFDELTDADLYRTKMLRGKEMLVAPYITRVLIHFSYHTGQIVLLAKQYLGDKWIALK